MDAEIWDIFAQPYEGGETIKKEWFETLTDPSVLGSNYVQTIQSTIRLQTRDLDAWILPHEAELRVQFVLATSAGAAPTTVSSGTLINGGWHLFKDVSVYLGGKRIEQIDDPGKVQIINGYASASNMYNKQSAEQEWFYPEKVHGLDCQDYAGANFGDLTLAMGMAQPINVSHIAAPAAVGVAPRVMGADYRFNESFGQRWRRTKAGRLVELRLKLSTVSGFCANVDKAIRGVPFEVQLNLNTEYSTIIHRASRIVDDIVDAAPAADAVDLRPIVYTCSLWMPRVVPSLAVASAVESQLAADAATKYVFDHMTVYRSEEYQQGTTSIRWKIVSEAHKPTLAFVAFQARRQYNQQNDDTGTNSGQYTVVDPRVTGVDDAEFAYDSQAPHLGCANGGLFSKLGDITNVEMRVNNYIVPVENYVISMRDESCLRAFIDFKKTYNKDSAEVDSVLDFQSWRFSPIFAFDLSKIGDAGVYSQIKTNDIEFRATVASSADNANALNDANDGYGYFGSNQFTAFCCLFTEVEMAVEARSGRLVLTP